MTSILNELYCGRVFPMEQIVPNDPGYFPLGKGIDEVFESLKQKLCEEDVIKLEKIITDCIEQSSMTEYAGFSYGLRLGVLLMSEVFSGAKK